MFRLGCFRLFAVLGLVGLVFVWGSPAWGHRLTLETRKAGFGLEERGGAQSLESSPGQPACQVSLSVGGGKVFYLLKSINVYPQEEQRPAALMELAGWAETQGWVDLAIKVYTLAATLYPRTPYGHRATLKRLILEFYLELGSADPFAAFRSFLEKLSRFSSNFAAEDLREPLAAGWRAVEQAVGCQAPGSSQTLGKATDLWELHPPGLRPPEGALVLGRLLKAYGLLEEAGVLLSQAYDQGTGPVRSQALLELLRLAWDAGGPPGFFQAIRRRSQDPREVVQAIKTWPLRLGPRESDRPGLADDLLDDLKEILANQAPSLLLADTPVGADISFWEGLLSQPLPDRLKDYLVQSVAKAFCQKQAFTEAEKLYREMLSRAADRESSLFLWDRLGLMHLHAHQGETAQDIFQRLAKEPDGLWPLVARTRQLDLELGRIMAEPAS